MRSQIESSDSSGSEDFRLRGVIWICLCWLFFLGWGHVFIFSPPFPWSAVHMQKSAHITSVQMGELPQSEPTHSMSTQIKLWNITSSHSHSVTCCLTSVTLGDCLSPNTTGVQYILLSGFCCSALCFWDSLILFFFIAVQYSIIWIYQNASTDLFIHFTVDGCFRCFLYLASVNILVNAFWCTYVHISAWHISRSRIAESWGIYFHFRS